MMEIVSAYLLGVKEGFLNPYGVAVGMTYEDDSLSEAYDRGLNLGERIGRLFR